MWILSPNLEQAFRSFKGKIEGTGVGLSTSKLRETKDFGLIHSIYVARGPKSLLKFWINDCLRENTKAKLVDFFSNYVFGGDRSGIDGDHSEDIQKLLKEQERQRHIGMRVAANQESVEILQNSGLLGVNDKILVKMRSQEGHTFFYARALRAISALIREISSLVP